VQLLDSLLIAVHFLLVIYKVQESLFGSLFSFGGSVARHVRKGLLLWKD
jgi:hypothetical protein